MNTRLCNSFMKLNMFGHYFLGEGWGFSHLLLRMFTSHACEIIFLCALCNMYGCIIYLHCCVYSTLFILYSSLDCYAVILHCAKNKHL